MEKNCSWHFDKAGKAITGPNDAIHETFKRYPYYSIVRESIQNSLDAVLDVNEPVKVVFSFEKVRKEDYPNLFLELKRHIIACWQTHKNDNQAKSLYYPMSSYIDKNNWIEIMKVSDYNTRGMHYDPDDYDSGFTSFLGEGKSSKSNQGSGGSFGFGKGAYFVLSKLRTLIVSTKTENNEVFFEGRTRLATHKLEDQLFTRDGFYNNVGNKTINKLEDIPEYFQRTEMGTDIFIIGLIEQKDEKVQMIKSVLNNFWLAIQKNELIVQIGDELIDQSSLSSIIDKYYTDNLEIGSTTSIESWNPKPYFKAVEYAEKNNRFQVFKEKLETLGPVSLFVHLEKGLPNRIAFFRRPKMLVYKQTNNKVHGYAAVFLCESEKGNMILREMENPAHDEWKKENYQNNENKPHKDARKAEMEIRNFINDTLDSISKAGLKEKIVFLGLEEYLSIPEDLLEKEEYDIDGNNINVVSGERSEISSDVETGMITTEKESIINIKPKIQHKIEVKEGSNVEQSNLEDDKITTGGENKGGGGNQPGGGDSNISTGKRNDDSLTKSKLLTNVRFHSFANKINGELFHILVINSDKEIENAELELLVGSDNDKEDDIEIYSSDHGTSTKNIIRNIKLEKGRNTIKIQFADDLPHSIKLKAYEIQ